MKGKQMKLFFVLLMAFAIMFTFIFAFVVCVAFTLPESDPDKNIQFVLLFGMSLGVALLAYIAGTVTSIFEWTKATYAKAG